MYFVLYIYIMYHVIRTTGGLLNEATKDQISLTELPFGEVYPGGTACLNIEISSNICYVVDVCYFPLCCSKMDSLNLVHIFFPFHRSGIQ